ncbi:unnamed protein product [Colias eurytheme]|nr:unnamed protein product [Colias eurytheme]
MCYHHISRAHDPASVSTTRAKPRAAHGEKSRRRIANKPPLLSLKLSADSGRIATSAVMPSTHNKIKRDDAIEGRASSAERRAPLRTALLDFT